MKFSPGHICQKVSTEYQGLPIKDVSERVVGKYHQLNKATNKHGQVGKSG